MTVQGKNTVAMNRAGAACGAAALCYLAARSLLTALAGAVLAARVPGATLANPAGASQVSAALLRLVVSALALAAPFTLLHIQPLPGRLPLGRGQKRVWPKLFFFFWSMILVGNLLAAGLIRLAGPAAPRVELPAGGGPLLTAFLTVCLLPAVGEELLFRGLLQGWLRPYGALGAVLGQAVLFALLHGTASACLAALFGGMALGLCAEWSGSLRLGMWFHLYNNLLAFAGQYGRQYTSGEAESFLYLGILLGIPLAVLLYELSVRARRAPTRLRRLEKGCGAAWVLHSPGWLCSGGLLAVLCLWQTFT